MMDTEHTRGHIMTRAEIEAILAGLGPDQEGYILQRTDLHTVVVRALCTTLKESMDRVEAVQAALEMAIKVADEAADEWDKAPEGMRAGKILLALAGHRPKYRADTDAIHAARKSLGGSNER
jgi:hypothetical protein